MNNLFLKYMGERKGQPKKPLTQSASQGAVITISREHGCFASHIAQKLADNLTKKSAQSGHNAEWSFLSKEIIEEAAKELRLTPEMTKKLTSYDGSGFVEDIMKFFSDDFYKCNAKVNNTIAKLIRDAASEGNVIIIGRSAEAILKDFKKSFHIKLIAPLEWRAKQLSNINGISIEAAKKEAVEFDQNRQQFRDFFEKGSPDVDFFDAFFNSSTMSEDEIVEMVLIAAETRGFI